MDHLSFTVLTKYYIKQTCRVCYLNLRLKDFGHICLANLCIDTRNQEDRKISWFPLAEFCLGGLDQVLSFQISGSTTGSQGCLFSTGFASLCNSICLNPLRLLPLESCGPFSKDLNNMMMRKKG